MMFQKGEIMKKIKVLVLIGMTAIMMTGCSSSKTAGTAADSESVAVEGDAVETSNAESELPKAEDFEYTVLGTDEIEITGYTGTATDMVFPSEIDGMKVVSIKGFNGNENFTSIVIPDTVKKIGIKAFYGNINVTSVELPDGLEEIGELAFSACDNLKNLNIPDSVSVMGDSAFQGDPIEAVNIPASLSEIPEGAFAVCGLSGVLTIPGSVKTIGVDAFAYDENVEEIIIEDGVECISDGAFVNCPNLKKVTIPASVTEITDAFTVGSGAKFVVTAGSVAEAYANEDGFETEVQ